MKQLLLMCVWVVVSGCVTPAPGVRCDGKLEPINAPAAAESSESKSGS